MYSIRRKPWMNLICKIKINQNTLSLEQSFWLLKLAYRMGHLRQIVWIYYRCKFRFISWWPVSQEGIINCSKENTVTIRSVLSCVKINKYQFSVPITWYDLFHLQKIINFHCCLDSQALPFKHLNEMKYKCSYIQNITRDPKSLL